MATDATGATTSPDGIPTYNTSVDAPSGLGFNATMAQIQVALSARVSKPVGIVAGETSVYNGTTFDRSTVTNLGRTSLAQITRKVQWPQVGGAVSTPSFLDGVTSTVQFMLVVPDDYVSGDLTVKAMMRSTVGGNNLRVNRSTYRFRDGVIYVNVDNNIASTIAVPATANQGFIYSFTWLAANFQAGDALRLDFQRFGADGADTNTGTADCDIVWSEYTGRA